jgi:hypothetical protein
VSLSRERELDRRLMNTPSALPQRTDILSGGLPVCFGPQGDISS